MDDRSNCNYRSNKTDNTIVFLFTIATIIQGLAVSSGDTTLSTPTFRGMLLVITYLCVFGGVLLFFIENNFKIKLTVIAFIPVIYWAVTTFNVFGGVKDLGLLSITRLLFFCILSTYYQKEIFILYRKYIVAMAGIGILFYFIYIFHLPFPYETKPYYSLQYASYYIDYKLCLLTTNRASIRLCGLFNEPGFFGTVLALILCTNNINIKKKENIVLFIAGLLTFSVAFVLIIGLYYVIQNRKNYKTIITLTVVLLLYILVLPNITFSNYNVQRFVDRIQLVSGSLVGDNRTEELFDNIFNGWIHGNNLLFGYGGGYVASITVGNLSYKTFLVNYGIVGFILIYIPLAFTALKKVYKPKYATALHFVICFLVSIYQRPNIFSLVYFTILYGGIETIIEKESGIGGDIDE